MQKERDKRRGTGGGLFSAFLDTVGAGDKPNEAKEKSSTF